MTRARIATIALCAGLLVGACSSGSSDVTADPGSTADAIEPPTSETAADPPASGPPATTVPGTATAGSDTTGPEAADSEDLGAFCATFADLGAQRGADGGNEAPDSEAGWQARIATVGHIADVAPDDIQAQADAYVQMTEDRHQLAADNGFVAIEDLPADAKAEFIASHRDLQSEVDQLIAYAHDTCDGF